MNKLYLSAALVAALSLGASGAALAAPKAAASAPAGGTVVAGLGWANIEAAEAGTTAFKTAEAQRPVTYKAQYAQAEARSQALRAQLKPLVDKYNADAAAAGGANSAALQQQAQAIQQIQQNGQAELQRIMQPVAYSQAYVAEQIEGKLQQAVDTAMAARGVTILLKPDALLQARSASYNLTPDITAQLNTLVPTAQLVPPAGWEPRELREARAQQAGQAPAASSGSGGR